MILALLLNASLWSAVASIIEKLLFPLIVAAIVFLLNYWRDSSKNYEARIKTLEADIIQANTRIQNAQMEREHLVDANERRLAGLENRVSNSSTTVDRLVQDVARLTSDMNYLTKDVDKIDKKIDANHKSTDDKMDKILEKLANR
ncbi:hypothetical protein [Hymenobacter sublimis]|uniref:DUF2746 domain-containing protein n=1 Tax=Hymenobacter sublimis TaxID=2933777 RepID=A0ABY4JFH5_9BACT|nr:hypothetical protein [Hymenobacter sublimis]UPL50537.1 hypothetical protein MWH26_06420 [Hymenobacter sublimis]